MEKIKLNNQDSKESTEHTTEEDLLASERKESEKQEKVIIEIGDQTIETEKSYFEYPEQIQKETQIKGYTKYKINKSQFDIPNPEYSEKSGKPYKEIFYSEEFEKTYKEILRHLSGGNFPDKTYNHRLQADDSYNRIYHQNELIKDRVLLAEITNIAGPIFSLKGRMNRLISVLSDKDGNVSFVGDILEEDNGTYTLLELKGTKNDIEVVNGPRLEGIPFSSKIISQDEFKKLMKNKTFTTTMQGLYTCYKNLFGSLNSPTFGFDNKESPFKEYINYAQKIYSKIPKDYITEKNIDSLQHLLNKNDKEDAKFDAMIPIITGDTDLPTLRWGHAKYAVIPTEKNFNFLNINHIAS